MCTPIDEVFQSAATQVGPWPLDRDLMNQIMTHFFI